MSQRFGDLPNVTVLTLHALAYAHTPPQLTAEIADTITTAAAELARFTRRTPADWPRDRQDAVLRTLRRFIASADAALSADHAAEEMEPLRVVQGASALWRAIAAGNHPLDHDCYMKMFQLDSGAQARALGRFDVVMLDEAHDCSEAQLNIVVAATAASIVVFDFHQRLYGFRGAVTRERFVASFSATTTLRKTLKQTWRYGEPLASACVQVVRRWTGDVTFEICGNPNRCTPIELSTTGPPYSDICGRGKQLTVIAAKNHTLLCEAFRALDSTHVRRVYGSLFAGVGDKNALLDLCNLKRKGSLISMLDKTGPAAYYLQFTDGFERYSSSIKSSTSQGKQHERNALMLLETYGERLPSLVWALVARMTTDPTTADVRFHTCHVAKGGGWPYVYLCNDFMIPHRIPRSAMQWVQERKRLTLDIFPFAARWDIVFSAHGLNRIQETAM